MAAPYRTHFDTAEGITNPTKRGFYKLVQPLVEKLLAMDRLNALAHAIDHHDDPIEYSKAIFKYFGATYSLPKDDIKRLQAVQGPLVIVSNHPFGGFESVMLMILMNEIRPDFRIMANYMLGKIVQMTPRFLLVDPFARENSQNYNRAPLREAFTYLKNGGFMGFFPSGQVATYNVARRKLQEPEWNLNIARLIQKTGATVVPLYFHGQNGWFFQFMSAIHPKLRTAMLVREFVNKRDRKIHFQIGSIISPDKIKRYPEPELLNAYLRSKTYILGTRYNRMNFKLDLIKAWQPKFSADAPPEPIVPAVDPALLQQEVQALPPEALLYKQKDIDVYIFNAQQGPNLLRELGRLREVTFRDAGEGTNLSIDLDEFDQWYEHLILWNREKGEVAGSYRLCKCDKVIQEHGQQGLYNNTEFHIRPKLYDQINPALELGRAFVRKEYQRSYWSLLLLWTGIGRYIVRNPAYHTLIGAVSISADFRDTSKDIMVRFLLDNKFAETLKSYVRPKNPYRVHQSRQTEYYNSFSIRELSDVQDMITEIERNDMKVPILIKHYLKMGGTIIAFNVDRDFNNVLDSLMCIDLRKTDPMMLKKYMGEEGYAAFARLHKVKQADDGTANPPSSEPADAPAGTPQMG